MKNLILILLVALSGLAACGPDACDPTGTFGCQQYTKHVSITLQNDASEEVAASFEPCECCSGTAQWTVPAKSSVTQTIKVVDQGGGDACDESAAYWHLSYRSVSKVHASSDFEETHDIRSVCNDETCDLGVKPPRRP